jgi:hypothetical protein
LKENGIEPDNLTGRRDSKADRGDLVPNQERWNRVDEGDEPRDLSLDHLVSASCYVLTRMHSERQVEREDGNVYLHGPTSAFRHLGKHNRDPFSGLNIYPPPTSRGSLQVGHSRYLPSTVQLSSAEHDQCLDRFFGYYACWGESTIHILSLTTGMRSNPILFKHDMALALSYPYPKTPHYSPMLHNAILAIALGFSDDPQLRRSSTRALFGTQAKSFIDEEGMTPSVATVQAFAHLASYHSLGAEHNLGWLYIGMALRCGIARESLTYSDH